jgi:hypothetical protein
MAIIRTDPAGDSTPHSFEHKTTKPPILPRRPVTPIGPHTEPKDRTDHTKNRLIDRKDMLQKRKDQIINKRDLVQRKTDNLDVKDPEGKKPITEQRKKQFDKTDTILDNQQRMLDKQIEVTDKNLEREQKKDERGTVLCALYLDLISDQIEKISSDLSYEIDKITDALEGKCELDQPQNMPIIQEKLINYDLL